MVVASYSSLGTTHLPQSRGEINLVRQAYYSQRIPYEEPGCEASLYTRTSMCVIYQLCIIAEKVFHGRNIGQGLTNCKKPLSHMSTPTKECCVHMYMNKSRTTTPQAANGPQAQMLSSHSVYKIHSVDFCPAWHNMLPPQISPYFIGQMISTIPA